MCPTYIMETLMNGFRDSIHVISNELEQMAYISWDKPNGPHIVRQDVGINDLTNLGCTDVYAIRATHSPVRCKYIGRPKNTQPNSICIAWLT